MHLQSPGFLAVSSQGPPRSNSSGFPRRKNSSLIFNGGMGSALRLSVPMRVGASERKIGRLVGLALLAGMVGPAPSASAAGPDFPLRVSANGRYLEDQAGAPFPVFGDSAWSAVHNLTPADQATYLDDRLSRGFDAVLIEAIEHKFTTQKPPKDQAGNLPFTQRLDGQPYTGSPNGCTTTNGTGSWTGAVSSTYPADPYGVATQAPDFTHPNETYWQGIDAFISLCRQNGVVVFMFPAYVGYAGG